VKFYLIIYLPATPNFVADRGILMTFGSGTHGSLGHGNYNDVLQAKIVEALIGFEVEQVGTICDIQFQLQYYDQHFSGRLKGPGGPMLFIGLTGAHRAKKNCFQECPACKGSSV